jgi:phage terminase large subunit-like protein
MMQIREKSSQRRRIHSATLRDDRGPHEIYFMGYGEKNRRFVLLAGGGK